MKELQRQASPNIVIALAGNKNDLANKRMVEYEEAQAYAEDNGLLFKETSAKTAMNVESGQTIAIDGGVVNSVLTHLPRE